MNDTTSHKQQRSAVFTAASPCNRLTQSLLQ